MSARMSPTASVPARSTGFVPFLDLGTTTAVVAQEVRVGWEKVIDSNHFVGGEEVEVFEREWAAYCGTQHAVGVGNGTDALLLALRALDLGSGDEIIVPANTFVATVEAVVLAGAIPRFADVAPDTGLMGAEQVEAAISDKTRAIVAVHMFGQLTDMDALGRCATRHGRVLIEDASASTRARTWERLAMPERSSPRIVASPSAFGRCATTAGQAAPAQGTTRTCGSVPTVDWTQFRQ